MRNKLAVAVLFVVLAVASLILAAASILTQITSRHQGQ